MTSFDGRLRLKSEPGLPLGVEIDLTDKRMVVMAGNQEVADWPLDQIEIESHYDGFHIMAEGEEVVLNVSDSRRFAREIGIVAG